jgi:hypothetical protein
MLNCHSQFGSYINTTSLYKYNSMIDLNNIKAGQIATILLEGEYELKTGGRSGIPLNIYKGRVTRKFRFTVNLAGEETYNNIYPDSVGKPNWFEFVKDGVVRNKKTGQLYLAGLPTNNKNNRFDLLVDNQPITQEQRDAIQQYRSDSDKPKFLTMSIDSVVNVEDPAIYVG